jgi:RNase P protein component
LRGDCAVIAQRLRSDCAAIKHRLRSLFAAITQRLRGDCAVIAQRLRSDCASIAQCLRGDYAAIAHRLHSDCASFAQRLRSAFASITSCECNDFALIVPAISERLQDDNAAIIQQLGKNYDVIVLRLLGDLRISTTIAQHFFSVVSPLISFHAYSVDYRQICLIKPPLFPLSSTHTTTLSTH